MAVVTPVKFGTPGHFRGTFHSKCFNLFKDDDVVEYNELRTRAANKSSGVEIESIQQFEKKTTITEADGPDRIVTVTDDLYLLVQWWEKEVQKDRGDTNEDGKAARKGW